MFSQVGSYVIYLVDLEETYLSPDMSFPPYNWKHISLDIPSSTQ